VRFYVFLRLGCSKPGRWPGPAVARVSAMWPIIITVVVIVPLLVVAWLRVRR
jgi:hypothetical protein